MRKFIIAAFTVVVLLFSANYAYYNLGIYIDLHPTATVTTQTATDEDTIYFLDGGQRVPFEIRGVNLGVGIPGKWATDYAIDKDTYLRWFSQIQEMGANTIRVYTIQSNSFYDAFYEYNKNREVPLYLLHGVWVNDYILNSHRDGFDPKFQKQLIEDCHTVVDIVHGNRNFSLGRGLGSGHYRHDISPWVLGYIVGVEWEDMTVTYTDHKFPERTQYQGEYLYTSPDATPFERMLCEVGDSMIAYETQRYKQQRLLAFSNWPTTDPFSYSDDIISFFMKCAKIDVEHIRSTDAFLSGQFASYHVYPYYPDYLLHEEDQSGFLKTPDGKINTYRTYLKLLADHHTIPVVISEYGVPTSRGMAQRDVNTGRSQGNISEQQQGEALIQCYEDIMSVGCAGSCVFSWQDEWFKRPWNTMHAVDLLKTPFWSDYQANEQFFGLLSFDPGKEKCICYVDGNISEWDEEDLVSQNNELSLSMKYDEKFLYFLIHKPDLDFSADTFYIPVDTTPKSGSTYCQLYHLPFERASDFLIVLNGRNKSRVLVQERYEVLRAMFRHETEGKDAYSDPVDVDTPVFKPINLMLQARHSSTDTDQEILADVYETGKLTYGNANPESPDYNSLADFICQGDYIEMRLPWQLLNFSNPSEMMIHDDYYLHYGVEQIHINKMYVGITDQHNMAHRIPMEPLSLNGWGRRVTYHERLKPSYFMLKDYWAAHPPKTAS